MAKVERKLPEGDLAIDFTICDNSVNRYGWRLLVQGIDHSGFDKNPVCLIMHNMWQVAIGKWSNLRVEGEELKGTLTFDRNDDVAIMYYWKYIDGYQNAVSLNVLPVEESDDPALLIAGQRYSTVSKSELLEISVVTVPGQKNAVKLTYADGKEYKLNLVPKNQIQNQNMAENKDDQNKELETLRTQLANQRKLNAKNLILAHTNRKVVQEGEAEHLQKLAEKDDEGYDTVEKMLSARKPVEDKKEEAGAQGNQVSEESKKLAEQMRQLGLQDTTGKPTGDRTSWTYYDWFRKDSVGLALMEKEQPAVFAKLVAEFTKGQEG